MEDNVFKRIREKYPLLDYARCELGLQLHREGDCYRGRSINPGNNETCLCIYTDQDRWYDFKEKCGGDVVDLCALLRFGGDRGAAVRELGGCEYGDWKRYNAELTDKIRYYHTQLRPEDWDYLRSRKIKDETVKRLQIGYRAADGRLTIPYFKHGCVVYCIGRDRTGRPNVPKYKKDKLDGLNEHVPWGLHTLDREGTTLVIAEGAFDAISFEQEGFMVLSPMGGWFNPGQIRQIISVLRNVKNTCICFDSDDAGRGFTKKMAEILFRYNLPFTCAELPANVKDVSDYYVAGGNLHELVANARPGIVALGSSYDDPKIPEEMRMQNFKEFVLQAARRVDKADVIMLLNSTSFQKNWLKTLEKQALGAPEEAEVSTAVLKDRHLLFNERTGFYEYAEGFWQSRDGTVIQTYIKRELGRFATGNKLSRILTLLKAETVSDNPLIFNKQPLMNFVNGTLELSTGVFRGHNKDDLLSFKLGYKYDSEAKCPRWDEFLEEITWDPSKKLRDEEGDARQRVLQEIAGYILFSDNRLQKSFFILGTGANGKSTFLNILASLFGRENVSYIEISQLGKDFHAIGLKDALMNISTEVRGSLDDAETNFKKIVTGDAIRDSFKGKEQFDFIPRAKMLVACNRFPRSRDTSYGFHRRILFLEFKNRFVSSNPDEKANQRLADTDLEEKLRRELPGIFNWAYKGYKRLLKQGEFSESPDHDRLMREYFALSNPLVDFIESYLKGVSGTISHKDLYEMYKGWCSETGHVPKGNRAFFPELKATLSEMNIPFDHKKTRELCFVFSGVKN